MNDLTPEEFDEMIELAVDEAIERSHDGKVTAPGLVIFLTKYGVNTKEGRNDAFKLMKELGYKVYSNAGYGGSGRLNNKG